MEHADIVGGSAFFVVSDLIHAPLSRIINDRLGAFSIRDFFEVTHELIRKHKLEHHAPAKVESLLLVMHIQ